MAYPFHLSNSRLRVSSTNADEVFADYMDRLVKLIPSEILGLYLTVRGFWIGGDTETNANPETLGFLNWWPIVCIVLLVIIRIWGTRSTESFRTTQVGAILLSARQTISQT